jgi:hypothetical protein
MMSHTAVATPNVVALMPLPGQADIEEKPTPDPRASSIKAVAAAATAPPKIEPQDIAGGAHAARTPPLTRTMSSATVSTMAGIRQCQNSMIKMMMGMGTPSSQSRSPRPIVSSDRSCARRIATSQCASLTKVPEGPVHPTRVANTMTVNPLAAALLATELVGEPITLNLVAGLVAVFAGIWIATTEGRSPLFKPARKFR